MLALDPVVRRGRWSKSGLTENSVERVTIMAKQSKRNKKPTWSEMSPGRRVLVVVMGVVQMALAATAWRDLARRPASEVNGKKGVWAVIIAVNWIGPIAYFVKGRQAVA